MRVVRCISSAESPLIALRQLAEGAVELTGLAAPYERYAIVDDEDTDRDKLHLRRTREKLAVGAFQRVVGETLRKAFNVEALINHVRAMKIADTMSNTLQLRDNPQRGLEFTMQLQPKDFASRSIIREAQEDNITGVSIGFELRADDKRTQKEDGVPQNGEGIYVQQWDEETQTWWRVLKDVRLHEISLLSGQNPAYGGTDVAII